MSGLDNEVFNTRERPVSNDHNDLQALIHRSVVDMMREMFVKRTFTLGLAATEAPRNVILGGLEVTPSGTDVLVAPGALMQESATLAPIPSALDSNYRLGILRSAATVTPPAPAGDTWYLLEAQMVEITTVVQSRDILDVPTATFVPANVPKQRERRVQFQFAVGTATDAPAPSGGDWVPLAIVFRPGGGGAVLAFHLIDARTMWDAEAPVRDTFNLGSLITRVRGHRFLLTSTVPGTPSNSVIVSAETYNNPSRLWYTRSGGIDVTGASILSPGTVLNPSAWYYLYLVPWQGIPVVDARFPFATGRGFLVLSSVAPAQATLKNTLNIPLPAPYGVAVLPGGLGVCVAALRRNAANTGWLTEWTIDDNEVGIAPILVGDVPALAELVRTTVAFGPVLPKTAKTVRVQVSQLSGSTTPGATAPIAISWLPVGVGNPAVDDYAHRRLDRKGGIHWVSDLPVAGTQSFDFLWLWETAPLAVTDPDLRFQIIGWSE